MTVAFNVGDSQVTLEQVRKFLGTTTLNSVRKVLPDSEIKAACKQAGFAYRERLITPDVVVFHMVLAALWPEESFAASWQVLWESIVSRLPGAEEHAPGSGSVAKARARIPIDVWLFLFQGLAQRAAEMGKSRNDWRGLRQVLLDGTCVSMSAQPALFEAFGTNNSGSRKGKYPIARLVTAALAESKTILAYEVGRYTDAETSLAVRVLKYLKPGDLLIGDRFFSAAHFYARYLVQGIQFLTRMHQCLKPERLKRLHSYSENDFIVELPLGPQYLKRYPELPPTVRVRLIQTTIRTRAGRETLWLVTSLLSDKDYPAAEIVALYTKRWRIEGLFRELKITLSADVLRSQKPAGIRKEIAARLLALNVVRTIMLEAGLQENVELSRISFIQTVRTILVFSPALATANIFTLPALYRTMLKEIAAQQVPKRPGRQEPRMVRRERVHYPTLKMTRQEWKRAYDAIA